MSDLEGITLAKPRGFCAGVDRAIKGVVVLCVAEKFGFIQGPIRQNHAAVHNEEVERQLADLGAPVEEDLTKVPDGAIYIFSAHGVPPSLREQARQKKLRVYDLTCQLVEKVHREVIRKSRADYYIMYLCKTPNHAEARGVIGENPGRVVPVTSPQDVSSIAVPEGAPLFFTTQTTLSMDDVQDSLAALLQRFPGIRSLDATCYATSNRQKSLVDTIDNERPDLVYVVGSPNSSNTKSLAKRAEKKGVRTYRIFNHAEIRDEHLADVKKVVITSGASTPAYIVDGVISLLKGKGVDVSVGEHYFREEGDVREDNLVFVFPEELHRLALRVDEGIARIRGNGDGAGKELLSKLAQNPFVNLYLLGGQPKAKDS